MKGESGIKIWLPFLLAATTAIGMLIGFRMSDESQEKSTSLISQYQSEGDGRIGRVEELLRFIEAHYVDDVDQEKLIDAATYAIFNELDPHSVYIPPSDFNKINQRMSGFYKGVGIETILVDDTLRITHVMSDSPAEKGGIQHGDKLLAVNDSVIAGNNIPIEDQWNLIKSNNEKSISLSLISRENQNKNLVVDPEKIKYPNVDFFAMEDNVGYIKINKFSDHTYEEIVKALEQFQEDRIVDKLILDLRENPGGYLPQATKILNQLFEEDKRLLVYTEGKKSRKKEYKTTGRPFYKINKMAVLLNRNSASASEIIGGAVQDWDKAIIVGEQSYGKGLVQDQYSLSNGGGMRLTIARYFTPSGRYIQTPFETETFNDSIQYDSKILKRTLLAQGGITPDIEVSWTAEEQRALKLIDQSVITDAYNFIISNQIFPKDSSLLFSDACTTRIVDYAISNLEKANISLSTVDLYASHLKSEIYKQMRLANLSKKALVSEDVFIEEALKAISKEDMFADFIEENDGL